jgi:histidinol-phosphate phosphatase family protein
MAVRWSTLHKVVFLDRDGLINVKPPEHDYVKYWCEFCFLPGVAQAIKRLNDSGYLVIIVTNQRGVARGIMTLKEVENIHAEMCAYLRAYGAKIDAIYICPHEEDTCGCRKPQTGMLVKAEKDYKIDKEKSWMIGDSCSDIECANRYGIESIKTTNLAGAVEMILGEEKK